MGGKTQLDLHRVQILNNLIGVVCKGDESEGSVEGLVYLNHEADIRCDSGMNLTFQRPVATTWSFRRFRGTMRFYFTLLMLFAMSAPSEQYRPQNIFAVK